MRHTTGLEPMRIRTYLATVILAVVSSFFCWSCGGKKKQFAAPVTNRDSMSVQTTYGMDMYISEAGVVRYHVIAEEWKYYDKRDPACQSFEKGVYVEVLDSLMQPESILTADTAFYFDKDKLWNLRHNVHAENIEKEEFDTPELFVDNQRHKMYSDSIIRIKQEKQIIIGHGFVSNDKMTEYKIRKTEGVFPIVE